MNSCFPGFLTDIPLWIDSVPACSTKFCGIRKLSGANMSLVTLIVGAVVQNISPGNANGDTGCLTEGSLFSVSFAESISNGTEVASGSIRTASRRMSDSTTTTSATNRLTNPAIFQWLDILTASATISAKFRSVFDLQKHGIARANGSITSLLRLILPMQEASSTTPHRPRFGSLEVRRPTGMLRAATWAAIFSG